MTARVRKIIALMFLLGFVVTAPLVVLTTKGYRYNWKRGRLEKTGILVVDSLPTDAAIYINGSRHAETTPTSLFRMLPEDYAVRLEKAGYLPWQKVLRIKSGETTFTQNVVLFRDAVPRLLEPGDIETAAFERSGRRVALLRRGDEGLELAVFDRLTDQTGLLARFSPDRYATADISWSPDGYRLLFQATLADGGAELSVYPALAGGSAAALPIALPQDGWRRAAWSDDGATLLITTDRGLFSASLTDGTLSTVMPSPRLQDAAAIGRDAYLLETEADKVVLEKTSLDGRGRTETLTDLPPGQYVFTDANERYLLLTGRDGESRLIERPTGLTAAVFRADRAAWEKSGGAGRLLLWNDFEIFVLDPAAGTPQLVTRLGTAVTGAAWHPNGRDLIYSTSDSVAAIELDDRDQRNIFELTRLTSVKGIYVDPSGETLLLVGTAGGSRGIFERDL